MNVLHVIPAVAPRYGGPSEVVISLARALLDVGVETEIATTDADGDGRLPVHHETLTDFRSVPVRFFRRQFGESFKFSRALEAWLRKEVGRFDVVHIHAVFSHSSIAAFKACARANVPYVVRPLGSLDPTTYTSKAIRKRVFSAVWGRRMLRGAAAVHYATAREQALVEKAFGLNHGFVAPAGVELDVALRPDRRPRSRGSDGSHRLVFLGRLDPIKRVELLIDAFSTVASGPRLSRWRLIIAGDGDPEYARALRDRAAGSAAGDRIEFTGWVSGREKADVLEEADLLALLSRHENFGRAAAEAMSLGVPVVVSEGVFLAEDVLDRGAGWVARSTVADTCRVLREAMTDPEARERAGRRARNLARERYNATRSAALLVDRYASLMHSTTAVTR